MAKPELLAVIVGGASSRGTSWTWPGTASAALVCAKIVMPEIGMTAAVTRSMIF